jgi:spermidine synthase
MNTTVVELDPAVTRMARKYFGLPSQVVVYDEDALAFVARESRLKQRYDIIVHDVFTGGAEPVSLFTAEFLGTLKSLLSAAGSIAVVRKLCNVMPGSIADVATELRWRS